MPLMLELHDSLPCISSRLESILLARLTQVPVIDPEPTPDQLTATSNILASELPINHTATLHPSIPTDYTPKFSTLFSFSHSQIESTGSPRTPGTGIDLTRYEEPTAPTTTSDVSGWRAALQSAYISQSYLTQRQLNLSLLERYGKNAWLIGNSQVEDELRALEQELAAVKKQVEAVEEERRQRQDGVRGEMEGLEESWRSTVGRAIEAEVAGEGLRREILERRRAGR